MRQAVQGALQLLSQRDRRLLALSVAIQMATSLLDLLGVLLIGLVGALAVTTVQSQPPPSAVETAAAALGLEDLSPQALVLVLAGAAAFVLLTKSMVSSLLTRRVLMFLANRQALVSARLTKALLSRPLTFVQRRSSQETAYALMGGVGAATSQILGQMVIAVTEATLLVVLGVALLFLSPWVAIGSIIFFAAIAYGLQRAMGGWAARVGEEAARTEIASMNAVQEALGAYREITVSNRRGMYIERIQDLRWEAAKVYADGQFIGMFPKYMFEAALVIGGFGLAAALFSTQDSVTAVGTLALFLAAGTRVMPSLLRLQGAALSLRGAAGGAVPTFDLAEELENPLDDSSPSGTAQEVRHRLRAGYSDFTPSIDLRRVTFTYPGSRAPALDDVTLSAAPGTSMALVGRSGAGKSTLADIILGILRPKCGTASLGGESPEKALIRWPGGISYVPQDVLLSNDTIRANVALGLPQEATDDDLVWSALQRAHLSDYMVANNLTLDTHVGERGLRLSGGQRQRLGIARALFTKPKLLVLDEATSALDAETETAISGTVTELEGDVTVVIIAHRLSTVRHVDAVAYLDEGRLLEIGSFERVAEAVPAFGRQVQLMGLSDR